MGEKKRETWPKKTLDFSCCLWQFKSRGTKGLSRDMKNRHIRGAEYAANRCMNWKINMSGTCGQDLFPRPLEVELCVSKNSRSLFVKLVVLVYQLYYFSSQSQDKWVQIKLKYCQLQRPRSSRVSSSRYLPITIQRGKICYKQCLSKDDSKDDNTKKPSIIPHTYLRNLHSQMLENISKTFVDSQKWF